ncbi:MAG: glycosyltransferase [Acetobacteraceae bacterium]
MLLITHADGGGVERVVQREAASHREAGARVLILRPDLAAGRGRAVRLEGDAAAERFALPAQRPALLARLRAAAPRLIALHHLLGHPPAVAGLIAALGVPYTLRIHDYAWFCPRVQLVRPVAGEPRYCGEPAAAGCEACVATHGSLLDEPIGPRALRARSAALLSGAARVLAPSADAARRIARHFPGIVPVVDPPEDDAARPRPTPPAVRPGPALVVVPGALGPAKGLALLAACARDAASRALPLGFVVVGYTEDDALLRATGRVALTGPFPPEQAVPLLRAQGARVGFLPSIWPETWCFALSDLFAAGLEVVAFDLGAPAERMRALGRGLLLAPGLDPPRLNHILLERAARAVHE